MRLAITGLGMVTSVGHDVATACASLRAGMSRPADLGYSVVDEKGMADEQVIGHPLRGITDGFQGVGRYVRIGRMALRDLRAGGQLATTDSRFWDATVVRVGLSRAPYDEIGVLEEMLEQDFPVELAAAVPLPVQPDKVVVVFAGHASGLQLIADAARDIANRSCERSIVICLDSLVDGDLLRMLEVRNRLKSADRAVGLMPGEAGAAVLVEDERAAVRRRATVLGHIGPIAMAKTPTGGDHGRAGAAMANVIATVLRAHPERVPTIYTDLNGEERRAHAWGEAIARVRASGCDFPGRVLLPALSLGDTGAASGGVAICAAVRSFVRGYAPGGVVAVASAADDGTVAAALLTKAT